VQIKLRSSAQRNANHIKVNVGTRKLQKNAARWRRLVGASIFVYVDPTDWKMFWVDLRDPNTIDGTYVLIPRGNAFDLSAKAAIRDLCGTLHKDQNYPLIDTNRQDFSYVSGRSHIQVAARTLYHDLRDNPVRLDGEDEPIRFLRSGWRHITRRERSCASRFQSFTLLGCVRRIVENSSVEDLSLEGHVSKTGRRLFSLRKYVTFPHRQSALVTVVLEKGLDPDGEFLSFYTVYEPRRKRTATGVARNEQTALSK
jgi:hypothetical protein